MFATSGSSYEAHTFTLSSFNVFESVSEHEICKIINDSPMMSCFSLVDELKDYQPVSGPCFLSKFVLLVVAKQLTSHIKSNTLDPIVN